MPKEDDNLTPEQFPDLNREFYRGDPAAYFKRRLHLLLVAGGANADLERILAEGVSYQGIIGKSKSPDDVAADKAERESFLATDSEVLLHHASEALMRLYFAHRSQPPCPWLECARLRNFSAFKQQLRDFQSPSKDLASIAEIFLGCSDLGTASLDLVEAVEAIDRLLRVLARRLLEDGNLYNAAKHGVAIIPGESTLFITPDDGSHAPINIQGQSLSFLEVNRTRPENPQWQWTTQWVNTKQAMWLSSLAITEIASLWAIAKWRYTGVQPAGVEAISKSAIDDALSGKFANGQPVRKFSVRLHYDPSN